MFVLQPLIQNIYINSHNYHSYLTSYSYCFEVGISDANNYLSADNLLHICQQSKHIATVATKDLGNNMTKYYLIALPYEC